MDFRKNFLQDKGQNFGVIANLYEEGIAKNKYKELKLALKNRINEVEARENNHSQLSQYEKSLKEAKKFYLEKYGSDVIELSDIVKTIETYKNVINNLVT